MPYVDLESRARFEKALAEMHEAMNFLVTPGELNYLFTRLAIMYVERKGENYTHLNDVMGALSGAHAEFYRRVVVPYEQKKIALNGDVFPKG